MSDNEAERECEPGCTLAADDDERHAYLGGCITDEDIAELRLMARDYEAWAAL